MGIVLLCIVIISIIFVIAGAVMFGYRMEGSVNRIEETVSGYISGYINLL